MLDGRECALWGRQGKSKISDRSWILHEAQVRNAYIGREEERLNGTDHLRGISKEPRGGRENADINIQTGHPWIKWQLS